VRRFFVTGHLGSKPDSLTGYLEAMAKIIFAAGMNWRVVEAKWDGISRAFDGFDPQKVASMTPADVDRLMSDPAVIRYRRKIEAIIENAQIMVDLDERFHGFDKYLSSRGAAEETIADLRRDFRFLGESSAYFFLHSVGRSVPMPPEWLAAHHCSGDRMAVS
jgi:DNA-3-methyladenine glycosylase I